MKSQRRFLAFEPIQQALPDTVASITFLNPEVWQKTVNVGKAAYELQRKNVPPVIFPKRAGSIEKVGLKISEKYPHAPWENLT